VTVLCSLLTETVSQTPEEKLQRLEKSGRWLSGGPCVCSEMGQNTNLRKEVGVTAAKPVGAVSVFTRGDLHPSTTVKAAFKDISTTRITLMGDSPGHSRESEACNSEERQNIKVGSLLGGQLRYVCVLLFIEGISDPLAEHDPYPYLFKLTKLLSTLALLLCYNITFECVNSLRCRTLSGHNNEVEGKDFKSTA